ncbi:alpha/beta hydrolase, partial [Acinetobacter baumannii]
HQGLIFHSIMGNITKSDDPNVITDGIVPYKSAHLEGAKSEKVLPGGHSIQLTPQAVLELRRILREHLVEHGLYKP